MKGNIPSSINTIVRQKIQKILVPYDGTKSSDRAFKNAINIAKTYGAEIKIITVIKDVATFGFFKTKADKADLVSEKIIQYAKSEDVDLIVMSRTKHGTAAEKMHNESTVEKVFNEAPCSFLHVK